MSQTEKIAWASGLFEGEGSVFLNRRRGGKTNPQAALVMTDKEPVVNFLKAVKLGKIYGPYQQKSSKKPCWRWGISGWARIENLFVLLRPWLSPRRIKQFKQTLKNKPSPRPESPACDHSKTGYGWVRHWKRGEPACGPCRDYHRNYMKQYRRTKNGAIS